MIKTHQPTTHQVSLSEDLDVSVERIEAPDEPPPIDQSVDVSTKVCVGKSRDHYHAIRLTTPDGTVVSMCPHHHHETITLVEAAEAGYQLCEMCEPIDWRDDPAEGDT